jgi:hypothetical protein
MVGRFPECPLAKIIRCRRTGVQYWPARASKLLKLKLQTLAPAPGAGVFFFSPRFCISQPSCERGEAKES